RIVKVIVILSRNIATTWPGHADHFVGVVVAVVNRLGHIGIGLAPLLGAFVDLPGGQLEAAAADDLAHLEQILGPLLGLGVPPMGEGGRGGGNGFFRVVNGGFTAAADDLTRTAGVNGIESLGCLGGTIVDDR